MTQHRVAVTGLGCVSSVGMGVPATWDALAGGRSGIGELSHAYAEQVYCKVAAEVRGYDEAKHFDERKLLVLDRFSQFALLSANEAIADAGIDFKANGLGLETATIIASGVGGWTTVDANFARMFKQGMMRPHPFTVPRMMISAATSQVSMAHGLKGPAFCVSSACSSSNHAIGEAYWMIRTGRARAAVTGGSEAEITLISHRSWESVRVMAPDTCRPFSKGRKGMVIGEGAGILVLERWDDAKARGARIYAEMVGYGLSADAGDIVMPDLDGAARSIKGALDSAALNPGDIDYINAHGTGTQLNDTTEVKLIKSVFGPAAARLMAAIERVTAERRWHTPDLGGKATTRDVTEAVCEAIRAGND